MIIKPPPGDVISNSKVPRSPGGEADSSWCSPTKLVGVCVTMPPKPLLGASVDASGLVVASEGSSSRAELGDEEEEDLSLG
jgi:hypothetical protein